ncbi:zinc-binding dehydrogenase [Sphingobium sp. SCG-1]|uniref:quinone oxidoreductase family protein n=1 Tax=Sphingobium sp. SCG-1 TaxID=2072936 RepID=UPI000CD6BDCF|nr:alcohol dehydrogenase catalytic domain-containing protein [Sphingobium sp. SCG-1]AUW58160.1 zinc-binding dehydrogenase [Sphingobium sp. SCG-1]
MKAIVQRETGASSVLKLAEIDRPEVRPRDVLIRVVACGVCYHDVVVRQGVYRKRVHMPLVPGHEVSGIIIETGTAVRHLKVGDRVCTVQRRSVCGECRHCRSNRETLCEFQEFMGDAHHNGGYAEFVAVAEDCTVRVPDGIPLEQASIVACAIGTQLNAIRDVAKVRLGETVLITGAGGTQGGHGVQVARACGAHVLALASSQAKADAILAIGASGVIVVKHGEDFSKQVREATDGRGVDVVIDNVGAETFHSVRRSLAQGGRWALVGAISGMKVPFNPAELFINGIDMLSAVSCSRSQLEDALKLVSLGMVSPIIASELPLEDAAVAHERLEHGESGGKLLLRIEEATQL